MAKDTVNRGRNDNPNSSIDLELLVRNTHRVYLNSRIQNQERSKALLALTLASELYRHYGPSCTSTQYKERTGHDAPHTNTTST